MEISSELRHLKQNYEDAVEDYTIAFISKHDYEGYDSDMWVAGEIGGIIMIGDMFIGFDDIRVDIDMCTPADAFDKYYWDSLECHELGLSFPNYKNWLNGAPTPDQETINRIKSLKRELESLTGKQIEMI